ncbi:hypothetical protein ACFO4N_03630 [Camelliibacillus cellulosilyticus]|uniref:Uncharacterized protein n=1 Tax=Camelliibacillus cellulosilyticus TaxID=2174486 RepID=A0ABV9GHP7_9BACL
MRYRKLYIVFIAMALVVVVSGCGAPGGTAEQNHIAYKSQITAVQEAVNDYKKDTGVLPIKNSTETTPIYKKYRIDFKRLVPQYMDEAPSNAYESGGVYQYVLVDAEKHPQVKVFDLSLDNQVEDIQSKIQVYRASHHFSPLGGIIRDGVYKIDFKQLGYKKPPTVTSPYSGHPLGFIMDKSSKVYIDYLPDVRQAVKKSGKSYPADVDLRALLIDQSQYVPVDSLPYVMNDGQVVYQIAQ